jgi:hypothetical protein
MQDRIVSYGIGMPQRPEYPNAVYWCALWRTHSVHAPHLDRSLYFEVFTRCFPWQVDAGDWQFLHGHVLQVKELPAPMAQTGAYAHLMPTTHCSPTHAVAKQLRLRSPPSAYLARKVAHNRRYLLQGIPI